MERYVVSGRIGEGAHGIVLKGFDKRTEKLVALKKIALKLNPCGNVENAGLPNTAARELLALRIVDHPNVVKLFDYFPQGYSLILVCEYLPSDLWETMRSSPQPLDPGDVKSYLWMLLSGLEYIHSLGIMHRDLKPANLLIAGSGELKIADFGLCRLFATSSTEPENRPRREFTHQVASRWYRAPELLYGARLYGPEIDLWAVGCIFGELLRHEPLFAGENDIAQLCTVIQVLGTPSEDNWPGVLELPDFHKISFTETGRLSLSQILPDGVTPTSQDLLERFLKYDPRSRITASEALNHVYFNEKPLMTVLEEMPRPRQKATVSAAEFNTWDWSCKHF